jgi:hypothetical protein
MNLPAFIEIDGRRFVWRELVRRRREQLQAAARTVQPALFELRDDTRPACERTAARRYLEPSLFTLLEGGGKPPALPVCATRICIVRNTKQGALPHAPAESDPHHLQIA